MCVCVCVCLCVSVCVCVSVSVFSVKFHLPQSVMAALGLNPERHLHNLEAVHSAWAGQVYCLLPEQVALIFVTARWETSGHDYSCDRVFI